MAVIYHITTQKDWKIAQQQGQYEPASLAEEGLIHCSEEGQIPGILERFFGDKSDLVRLSIDSEKLKAPLIYDWSPSLTDTFPHVYGPINLDAVIAVDRI